MSLAILTPDQMKRQNELLDERSQLALAIKESQHELSRLNGVVRTQGQMAHKDYEKLVKLQQQHKQRIWAGEQRLSLVKRDLRKIADTEKQEFHKVGGAIEQGKESIVRALVSLREEYQNFAADGTRVSSMRTMAAEFVTKLNPIIRNTVNKQSPEALPRI